MTPRNVTHSALREATSAAHQRVDRLFGRFDLTERDSYAAFLSAHAAALLPIEAWLDRWAGGVIADWPLRRRGLALRRDLEVLRVGVPDAPLFQIGSGECLAAGVLYVVEGARFGGRVLARSLPPSFPRAYLDPPQTAATWPRLIERLDAVLGDRAAMDAAVIGAIAAFARFERSQAETVAA